MKLTNIRHVGCYNNPSTGRPVNVKSGKKKGTCFDIKFYYHMNKRVLISDFDFSKWEKA